MQTAYAIGCLGVLLLVGVPFAIAWPWRAAMVAVFIAAHVAAMIGYESVVERLGKSGRPAARRVAAAHSALAGLISGAAPYDGPDRRVARTVAQATAFVLAAAFYMALLLWMGNVLDALEGVAER